MERADSCRRAAREAVADVEPPQLHDLLVETVDGASMTPGVLAMETARRLDGEDLDGRIEAVSRHAAGVQLIYEGLSLIRRLANEEPWSSTWSHPSEGVDGPTPGRMAPVDSPHDPDLEILAADILVARGFYLLARTEAAEQAVRTVRAFGHDQAPEGDDDGSLERDVLELAVLAGGAAVDRTPTHLEFALVDAIAERVGVTFPPIDECLPDPHPSDPPADEAVSSDRATSVLDP